MKALITLNHKIKNSITPSYNTQCIGTVAQCAYSLEISRWVAKLSPSDITHLAY